MFKRLLILLSIILISFHLSKREKPKREINLIRPFTIENLVNNRSITNFVQDSISGTSFLEANIEIKFAPLHPRIGGLTTQISPGVYFIQINPLYPFHLAQKVLMHELVHVHQFHSGLLFETNTGVIWKGTEWSWLVPWSDRPWEIQAEEYVDKLFEYNYDK